MRRGVFFKARIAPGVFLRYCWKWSSSLESMLIISEPCVPPMFGDGSANSPKNKNVMYFDLPIVRRRKE